MRADTITKDYLADAVVFADVFNTFIYGGEQVILPQQLAPRDPTEIALPYGGSGAVVPIQKFRDVQKLCAAMTDGDFAYVLYGIEAQSEIHYAAAVKNNLYDAIEYAGQVEEASRSHRRAMKRAKEQEAAEKSRPAPGEFLGGFWKSDRLVPSVTVMVYFSPDAWDGPLSLLDMMEVKDPRILPFLNDYRVHLIAPAQMSDEEILRFQSSLREVMFFIKYSKDRENLIRILQENEKRFREVERRAADVIEAVTHMELRYEESEAKVDMCQAIQELRMESRREGEQKGEQIGELKKAKEIAGKLHEMGLDTGKIAQVVGYALETVKEWLGLA